MSQVRAIDIFHAEKVQAVLPSKIINRDNVRMIEFREGSCFTLKPFRKTAIIADVWPQNLERHNAIQFRLAGLVNDSHTAVADMFLDL